MNIENSRNYYGQVLGGSVDLRTDACCTSEAPPLAIRNALARVHDEVRARYYGCGLVVPDALEGLRARHQFNPFKLIIYSELAGQELR